MKGLGRHLRALGWRRGCSPELLRPPRSGTGQAVRVRSVVVVFLSEHPEHLDRARELLEEYVRLPDGWERFGGVPDRLPKQLEAEIAEFPGAAWPPVGDVVAAIADGEVVGVGHLLPAEDGACEFKRVFVRSERRGTGIGAAVAQAMIARARDLGYSRALLDVAPERPNAVRFWQSTGFTLCAPFRHYPFTMTFMTRSLGAR
jgi:putative acetyltransferase